MNSPVDHQDNWSSLTAETALERFGSSGAGLSDATAVGRLAQYGLNRLPSAKRRSAVLQFLLQFHNVLLYVLLSASAFTASLGNWVDTGVILAVVVINAAVVLSRRARPNRPWTPFGECCRSRQPSYAAGAASS